MTRMNPQTPITERLRGLDAVLFDLDGTLLDTIPHILASFRYATTTVLGSPLPDETLMRNVGIPLATQMRLLDDDEATAKQLLDAYKEFNSASHDEMARLFPGTREALGELSARRMPLGVVTSKGTAMARRGLDLFELGDFFAVVVTSDDTSAHKPDPDPVLHAAALLGASPARCLYVGDSPHDVEAGRAAGAITAAATWGVSDRECLVSAEPDIMVDDIRELAALLCTNGQDGRHGRTEAERDATSVASNE